MTWAKLDDAYPHHPKVLTAGLEALGFDAAAMCYANRYGTDGVITASSLPAVYPAARSPKRLAAKLVEVGRWHEAGHECPDCPQTDDGWVIHDFLEFNPTAEEAAELSKKRAKAGRTGGKRSKPPPPEEPPPEEQEQIKEEASASDQQGSKSEASASGESEANEKQTGSSARASSRPDPSTSPNGDGSEAPDDADAKLLDLDPIQHEASSNGHAEWHVDATARWLGETREFPSRHAFYDAVLSQALDHVPPNAVQRVSMGLISEFVQRANDAKLANGHRSRLAKLVANHQPETVLYAVAQSVDWGAGMTGEHANNPDAWIDYVTAVVQKREKVGA